MIEKHKKKFIIDCLQMFFKKHPEFSELPVWVLEPTENLDEDIPRRIDHLKRTIRTINKLEKLPLPDENCILLCSDSIGIGLVISDKDSDWLLDSLFCFAKSGNTATTTVFFKLKTGIEFYDLSGDLTKKVSRIDLNDFFIKANFSENMEDCENKKKFFKELIEQTPTAWCIDSKSLSPEGGFYYCYMLCRLLGALIYPCGYMKCSIPLGPYGKGSERYRTKNKKLYSLIQYDRIHTMYTRSSDYIDSDTKVSIHKRRGHLRHFWILSGIDKSKLPDNAEDRLIFAEEHNVRRKLIAPMWVGKKTFNVDGETLTIHTEDLEF